MAESTVRAGLTPAQWDDQFFREYVRANQFAPYLGTDEGAIIQIKDALTRKPGDRVSFAATRKLKGAGVEGNEVLEGNEDELDTRSLFVTVRPLRNAVVLTDWDEQRSAIDMRDAAKYALKDWIMEKMRNDILSALGQVAVTGGTGSSAGKAISFDQATATQRNTWLAANADRVLFGVSKANNVGNDAAASLATLDNTADKMSTSILTLAKRMARTASPAIRPFKTQDAKGREWFVVFMNSYAFRDLQNDPVMQQANRDARAREGDAMNDNPIFVDGDLLYNGLIIREIPELNQYLQAGAGGIQVGPSYLVGAQALGVAWAQRTKSTTDTRDYGFRNGVGIQEIRGINKLQFGTGTNDTDNLTDNGVFTIWTAAVADA